MIMLRKWILAVVFTLILMTSVTGCGIELDQYITKEFEDGIDSIKRGVNKLKDGIEDVLNNWLEAFSKHDLTEDKALKGERKFRMDDYVGSYRAEYSRFSGENFIVLEGDDFTGKLSLKIEE